MKTVIQFSSKIVNLLKKSIAMKSVTHSNVALLTAFLFLMSFIACQKDKNLESTSSFMAKKPSVSKEIPAGNIISIEDDNRPSALQATPRADLADIDDVPVVTSGGISNCGGTEDGKIRCALAMRFLNSIKPGQRVGIADNLNTNTLGTNVTSCYTYGGQNVCGYIGKENLHPLFIAEPGNYRLQLTPKNPNRDYDVFVYRLTVLNKVITRTLIGYGVFPQGKTETVNITATDDDILDIVVDEYPNTNGQVGNGDGNYILSLSPNTLIKTTSTYDKNTNEVSYQFSLKSIKANNQLHGWLFRKKQGNTWLNLGIYNANNYFNFSCDNCDYLVAPIYESLLTGVKSEGTATVIRP